MPDPSEIDYRRERERWHLQRAAAATTDAARDRHIEMARRYADFGGPLPGLALSLAVPCAGAPARTATPAGSGTSDWSTPAPAASPAMPARPFADAVH